LKALKYLLIVAPVFLLAAVIQKTEVKMPNLLVF